jgi:type IV pilus assembly protein PilM
MASQDSILAIDIGGDSLKIAEFSYPVEGGIILEGFAFTEYGGDMKESELLDSLSEVFAETLSENGFLSKNVHISISGQSAFVRFVKLPPVGEEEDRVRQIVEYEARQNVPFPMDEVVWDYQLISGAEEDSEIEVMFVVVKNELIERITNIVHDSGREVKLIEVAPTCCYNAARANEIGEDECEMILNIGGRCSSLVFIDSGRFFVRTIPIAGHSVTQQVSKEFGIPFADAEEMKRRHGFVALGGAYEEPDSEVAATVSKIVRNVMTRLHGEINRSINVYRSQQKGKKPTKLYLAGGSSVMAFTPRFFSEKLRIPVEYFNPFQVVSLSPEIDRENLAEVAHMFSEVIGLGLRHATVCPIEISLIPDVLKKQNELRQKIPYFYGSAVSLILCLLITYYGVYKQNQGNLATIKYAEDVVENTSRTLSKVKAASSEKNKIEKNYNEAFDILAKRKLWVDILNELQNALPDSVWFTKIEGTSKGPSGSGVQEANQPTRAGGGLFDAFRLGGGGMPQAAAPVSEEINFIKVTGHSLLGNDNTTLVERFKNNLMKSPLFDIKKLDEPASFDAAVKFNNVTTFVFFVRLKNPIK